MDDFSKRLSVEFLSIVTIALACDSALVLLVHNLFHVFHPALGEFLDATIVVYLAAGSVIYLLWLSNHVIEQRRKETSET